MISQLAIGSVHIDSMLGGGCWFEFHGAGWSDASTLTPEKQNNKCYIEVVRTIDF